MTENDTVSGVENEVESQRDLKPDYIKKTLESAVVPLELRFSQINNCRKKVPVAYRTFTYINSIIEGVLPPERYAYAADETDRGVRMTKWNIAAAADAIRAFKKAGRNVDFVSVRVSPQIVRELDFYNYMKDLLMECGVKKREKLCLEFPRTVFFEDEESVRSAILALKLLKVKSMLAGCGEHDCPITPLFELPFDYVLVAPEITPFVSDRNRSASMLTFLQFLRTLKCEIIAEGVVNDDQMTILDRADCYGYMPSEDYSGSVDHGQLRMPLNEAVLQSEVEAF